MKTLNHSEFINWLRNTKGAVIVGIVALTDARAKKTNNPFGTIYKQTVLTALIGGNYENSVKNEGLRQDKEIEFKAAELPYGVWAINNKLIEHKGEFHLRTSSTPGQRKRNQAKILSYRAENGKFVSYDDIKQFLPEKRESTKQQSAGLNETVFIRNFKLANIQKIRFAGETYLLKPDFDTDKIKQIYSTIKPEIRSEKLIENKI